MLLVVVLAAALSCWGEQKKEAAAREQKPKQAPRATAPEADLLRVTPNAYGLGKNADQYGRPHQYRLQDGRAADPIFQGGVKRDAYGLGVHMDQFGRAVRDGKP